MIEIFKALNEASRALAELKVNAKFIPNKEIMINTFKSSRSKI